MSDETNEWIKIRVTYFCGLKFVDKQDYRIVTEPHKRYSAGQDQSVEESRASRLIDGISSEYEPPESVASYVTDNWKDRENQ